MNRAAATAGAIAARRPRARVLVLAAGLGALVAAGQAPLGAWYVALPALAAAMALIARQGGVRAAAWCGWLAGAGHFAAALGWIVEPFLVDVARHGWMAPFALVLMAFGMALFWAAAAAGAAWLGGGARWRRALALAVTLAMADLARGHLLSGFPWASIGHIWIGTPAMQLAAFVGPVGLSLLATGLAALPAMAAGRAGLARGIAAALAGLALAMGAGAWRARAAKPAPPSGQVVRLVQPNATQRLKWDRAMIPVFYRRQLDYTAAGPRPDLVIWPETALPWLLEDAGLALAEIAAAARGAPVALGIQRREGRRAFNSLVTIDAAGAVGEVYDKHHLVPFGEYMPLGDFAARFGLRGFAAQEGAAYTPGPGPRVLDLGALGRALPLICYEAIFPQDMRAPGPRPDWLLQVTNDGWFGTISGPWQHLAQARLRAVEQGLPLLRAANTGVSAVIDAHGRIVARLGLNEAGYLDAALPGALPPTPYGRSGDWPPGLVLAALVAALAVARRHGGD